MMEEKLRVCVEPPTSCKLTVTVVYTNRGRQVRTQKVPECKYVSLLGTQRCWHGVETTQLHNHCLTFLQHYGIYFCNRQAELNAPFLTNRHITLNLPFRCLDHRHKTIRAQSNRQLPPCDLNLDNSQKHRIYTFEARIWATMYISEAGI